MKMNNYKIDVSQGKKNVSENIFENIPELQIETAYHVNRKM